MAHVSNQCRQMFDSNGEITPPFSVPPCFRCPKSSWTLLFSFAHVETLSTWILWLTRLNSKGSLALRLTCLQGRASTSGSPRMPYVLRTKMSFLSRRGEAALHNQVTDYYYPRFGSRAGSFLTQRRKGAEKIARFEFFESYLLLCNLTPSTPDGWRFIPSEKFSYFPFFTLLHFFSALLCVSAPLRWNQQPFLG